MPVQTLTAPLTEGMEIPNVPASSWQDEYGLVTASGDRLPSDACWQRTEVWNVCPADMNVVAQYVDYHPSSHYWPIQLIETGIVLALAAVALYAAFRVLRARHRVERSTDRDRSRGRGPDTAPPPIPVRHVVVTGHSDALATLTQ
ncbi:hypothetical protein [Streptomyces narbonensis]